MAGIYEMLNELEAEIAGESGYESSYEADREAEQFFGTIAKLAKRAASSPALRKVAGQAARGALSGGMSALQGHLSQLANSTGRCCRLGRVEATVLTT